MGTNWLSEIESDSLQEIMAPLIDPTESPTSKPFRRAITFKKEIEALRLAVVNKEAPKPTITDACTLVRLLASGALEQEHKRVNVRLAEFLELFTANEVIQTISSSYGDAPNAQRSHLMLVLACQETEPAAIALKSLVREHGFPSVYPRVFWKLREHVEGLSFYALELVENPGVHLGDIVNLINHALYTKKLDASVLDPAAALIEERINTLLPSVLSMQAEIHGRWHRDREYFGLRSDLAAWIDLAGIVPACSVNVLKNAHESADPVINLFLVTALIAKEASIPASAIAISAESYETTRGLYHTLQARAHLHLYPKDLKTFEHFAAADMVSWLSHPSELGEEPETIELHSIVERDQNDHSSERYCLWRFTDAEGEAFAGVSGPFTKDSWEDPTPETVRSEDTFSNFKPWDEATPSEHLEAVLETLGDWKLSRYDGTTA